MNFITYSRNGIENPFFSSKDYVYVVLLDSLFVQLYKFIGLVLLTKYMLFSGLIFFFLSNFTFVDNINHCHRLIYLMSELEISIFIPINIALNNCNKIQIRTYIHVIWHYFYTYRTIIRDLSRRFFHVSVLCNIKKTILQKNRYLYDFLSRNVSIDLCSYQNNFIKKKKPRFCI